MQAVSAVTGEQQLRQQAAPPRASASEHAAAHTLQAAQPPTGKVGVTTLLSTCLVTTRTAPLLHLQAALTTPPCPEIGKHTP
jgi:hypothetical protein